MQVAVMDAKKETIVDRVPPVRPITVQDLFRHTSGLIYGNRGNTAVHKLYPDVSKQVSMTTTEFIDILSSRPLLHHPGAMWDYGFGLGVAVRTTPGISPTMTSVGTFAWPGASGTNWWVDPREDLVVVWMAHSPGAIRWRLRQVINALVYQALVD